MKKSTSRSKPGTLSHAGRPQKDQRLEKDTRPERYNRARPAGSDTPEPHSPLPGGSTIHNGSANAFDATEEVRD